MTVAAEQDTRRPAVDWSTAASVAKRLVGSGPVVPVAEAVDAVRQLRAQAITAEGHVRKLTGLGHGLPIRPGDVVDRAGWIDGVTQGLDALTRHALATSRTPSRIGAGAAGVQAGVALGYLGSKVLGQYDPFGVDRFGAEGRLLLVAPNIVAVHRALDVPAADFRLWVCLHEATHRLQFTAVPWLRDHFAAQVTQFMAAADTPASAVLERVPAVVRAIRGGEATDAVGVVALLQAPEQRDAMHRVLALATLLEGHADHVMDAVGPEVVPSVATIRRRFTARRSGGGVLDRVLRALLGVDAKVKQYAQGSAFTRHVVDAVGMARFNTVWTSPDTLPTRAEIADPAAWLRRVDP